MSTYRSSDNVKNKYFYYDGDMVEQQRNHCRTCKSTSPCSCNASNTNAPSNESFFNNSDATINQEGDEYSLINQESAELIWVKESCNITVNTTDTQAAVSLQAGLQLAIALVVNIAIGDSNRGEMVSQDLMQQFSDIQTNKQKIYIYNSKDINVTTTDTDLAINIQVLLQVLVALVLMIDIL